MLLTTLSKPDDENDPPDRLVTLTVVYSLPDMVVMQATLRAYDIPSFTSCGNHASVAWYGIMARDGIAIYVLSSQRDLAISFIPDLANPRSRAEITAEIKARGGPYARKRIITAHLMIPVLTVLSNPIPFLLDFFVAAQDGGIIGVIAAAIGFVIAFTWAFLDPMFGLAIF